METTEVVVVGAGPTGLAMAGVLADRGVDHVLFDRAATGATTSRAAVVHAGTLEALGAAATTLIDNGLPVTSFAVRNRDHMLVELDMGTLHSPYPYALMIPQDATERLLTERLAALGSAPRRGLTATALRVDDERGDDERATVELTDDAGTTHSVSARYVIGADGMHGTVRDLAGIGFDGSAYRQSFVLADVEVDWSLPSRQIQLFLSDEGLVVVAPLPGGRHRVVATMDDAPERPAVDDIARLLGARGPSGPVRVSDVRWSSRFRVHHRLASSYRRGPVFLVGDAAHVHSPAGGQGMNLGIQDAVVLADLLAGVLRDNTDPAVLDEYERRRRPIAREVIRFTDRMTRAATLRGPVTGVRDLVLRGVGRIPAARRRFAHTIAQLGDR